MERRGLSGVRLVSSDLDGTLTGDPAATRRFAAAWAALPAGDRPYLVYNSGRLIDDVVAHTAAEGLPPADFVIGGVGTEIVDPAGNHHFEEFTASLSNGWDRRRVDEIVRALPGVAAQEERYQHEHKSSWFLHDASTDAIADLSARLAAAGLAVQVVYSSGRDLDVLPDAGTKGNALLWLAAHLKIPAYAVVVAGDTGNDLSMFRVEGVRGILVGNAHAELVAAAAGSAVYRSPLPMADGVIDGLRHFGVFAGVLEPDSAAAETPDAPMAPHANSR